jgi:hypothetical protein
LTQNLMLYIEKLYTEKNNLSKIQIYYTNIYLMSHPKKKENYHVKKKRKITEISLVFYKIKNIYYLYMFSHYNINIRR